jgi:PAS domain S-box-containing protein
VRLREPALDDLRQSEGRLHAVIDSSPLAIAEVDLESRVIRWNPAAERIFGWTREDMLGRTDAPIVPDSKRDEHLRLVSTIRAGHALSDYETIRRRKDGTLIDVAIAAAPVRDASGRVVSNMVVYSDITERKRQQACLAEAQEIAHIGSWEWDIVSNHVTWSEELYRLWGREPGSGELSYESYLASVHPDDRTLVAETVGQAYAVGTPFAFEHRVPLPGGRVRWISSRGQVVTDDAGTPVRMLGTAQDITERKLQEAELERLNAELQARLEDLAASRARIVAAGDVERRRLERNLHDGAQQRLVSLALSLRVALDKLDGNPDAARQMLDAGAEELAIALEELRELARGLHPALLTDQGLGPALKSLARGIPVRVVIVETPGERLAEPIEVAAYYLIAEALTNVAKYARATTARVRVAESGDKVVVEVRDDGVGGADAARGSGLQGLADRVEALGGRLELASPVGAGTTVRAEIPARSEAASPEAERHQPKDLPAGLTEREVDVLRLIAVGLTDAAAADRLFLSVRTVNAHLRSIYRKLGVSSRAAAGRFAQSTGLL